MALFLVIDSGLREGNQYIRRAHRDATEMVPLCLGKGYRRSQWYGLSICDSSI